MTVSLIGRICTACCPVFSAHEIKVFKSPKSPVPQLPERKYWDCSSSYAVRRSIEEHFGFGRQIRFPSLERLYLEQAVRTGFPFLYCSRLFVNSYEFIFERRFQGRCIKRQLPYIRRHLVHPSSVSCHTLGDTSFIRIGRQYSQFPKALQLPIIPSTLPSA